MSTEQQPEAPALPGVTRYRNRPAVIDAIQWDGSNDDEVDGFAGDVAATTLRAFKPSPRSWPRWAMLWTAPGRYRQMEAGWWVIRQRDGSLGAVSADDFAAAYEPAETPDAESPAPVPTGPGEAARGAAEAISIQIARALYDSIDRCARCKVCEHQCGAAAKVAVEAVRVVRARAEAAEAKLAAIAEICQRPLLGTAAEVRWAADILAIIGSETQERSEEKGQGNA